MLLLSRNIRSFHINSFKVVVVKGRQVNGCLTSPSSQSCFPSVMIAVRTFCEDNSVPTLSTKTSKKWVTLKVDRSSLVKYDISDEEVSPSGKPTLVDSNGNEISTSSSNAAVSIRKEELSELGKELKSYIGLRGPITLHEYVSQSAMHFVHGYYQNKSSKIGSKGDFVSIM